MAAISRAVLSERVKSRQIALSGALPRLRWGVGGVVVHSASLPVYQAAQLLADESQMCGQAQNWQLILHKSGSWVGTNVGSQRRVVERGVCESDWDSE